MTVKQSSPLSNARCSLNDDLVIHQRTRKQLILSRGLLLLDLRMPQALLRVHGSIGVETEQNLLIAQRILLLHSPPLRDGGALDRTQHTLHLGAVDELGDVGLRDDVGWEEEVALELAGLGGAAVDGVESGESGGGPDDEAAEVASWRELEQVERVDGAGFHAGDVAEGAAEGSAVFLWLVDDERAAALGVSPASHLSFACTQLAGVLHFLQVWAGADGVEEADGGGGLADGAVAEDGAVDDEGHFGHGGDVVAAGQEEGGGGRGGDGGGGCEALLSEIDLLMPLAPDFGGCEHAAGATLVAERCLACTMGTAAGDARDTCDSAAWSIVSIESMPNTVTVFGGGLTYQYPKTQHWSDGPPSRSRHTAASCSSPCQCEPSCHIVNNLLST